MSKDDFAYQSPRPVPGHDLARVGSPLAARFAVTTACSKAAHAAD